MTTPGSKRLSKELVGEYEIMLRIPDSSSLTPVPMFSDLQRNGPPAGTKLISAEDLSEWIFELQVLGESVYAGEVFRLKFRFSSRYPWDGPSVTFVTKEGFVAPEVSMTCVGWRTSEHTDDLYLGKCATPAPSHVRA